MTLSFKVNNQNGTFKLAKSNTGYRIGSNSSSNLDPIGWNILNVRELPSFTQSLSVSSKEITPSSLFFKPDGTKMYIIGTTSYSVHEYSLSSAWDISTASLSASKNLDGYIRRAQSLFFTTDGLYMYFGASLNSGSPNRIYKYSLG